MWSAGREFVHPRPADECPYRKPFPPDFNACPAYQATQMVALDISMRPLGSVLTCRHLEGRLMRNTDYRWYGACVIGDAEGRRRWSESVGAERLHRISALRQEVSQLSTPFVQRLWELKAMDQRDTKIPIQRQIEGTVDDFMTKMTSFLRERRELLDDLHLPLDACIRLLRIAIDRFVEQGLSESDWEVPNEVLALFPADVRAYFQPRHMSAPKPRGSASSHRTIA